MTFAQVANDLDRVVRTLDGIRLDHHENLFLIVQMEGRCGVAQGDREVFLETGDCILLDSTQPLALHFFGHFSNHLSLHLPRQHMYSGRGAAFDVGRKLSFADPMVAMLRALIEKTIETPAASPGAQHLRELILSATRQAFFAEDDATSLPYLDTSKKRLQVAELLIDRHLTEPYLGGKWLAGQLGVSPRTLQEDFQGRGTTCTTVIRNRRLRLAREKIEQIHTDRSAQTISEIAYDCGFNDISYFNRSFKEMFACAPGDMLKLRPA
ncbi:hypothetical protein GCM10010909_36920 [Acidocella aquatica]|uniref:HTH araC/xylS-type domain-containing protein n=2 Tax=Acidocella aquatica TaxID=1922313 RepID=A0ABQ6A948_9PROT|nr:hypothetical protein GCM10010909_36920 [Acidocella aquatica]